MLRCSEESFIVPMEKRKPKSNSVQTEAAGFRLAISPPFSETASGRPPGRPNRVGWPWPLRFAVSQNSGEDRSCAIGICFPRGDHGAPSVDRACNDRITGASGDLHRVDRFRLEREQVVLALVYPHTVKPIWPARDPRLPPLSKSPLGFTGPGKENLAFSHPDSHETPAGIDGQRASIHRTRLQLPRSFA